MEKPLHTKITKLSHTHAEAFAQRSLCVEHLVHTNAFFFGRVWAMSSLRDLTYLVRAKMFITVYHCISLLLVGRLLCRMITHAR